MTATQQALLHTKMDAVPYFLSTGQCQWSKQPTRQKNIKSFRLCSMEEAWLRFSSSSTAKVISSLEVGSMCFLQCSLLCSSMNLILEREREKHQPKLMQLRSSLAVISSQGRGFPGCCPFLWFWGRWGGHILSCLTAINMWQLMRSNKDF